MSITILSGRQQKPPSVILGGTPGSGKTTTATQAERPIIIPTDDVSEADCDKFPQAKTSEDVEKYLRYLRDEKHEYKSAIVDTIDGWETLVHQKILADDPKAKGSMAMAHGGYGKAYEIANSYFVRMRDEYLKPIRDDRNMNVILIVHSKKSKGLDPVLSMEFDTNEMCLHPKVQSTFSDWVGGIFFINYVNYKTTGENSSKTFLISAGERAMYTERRPSHFGKNRWNLPYQMPLDWNEFYKKYLEFYNGKEQSYEEIAQTITGLCENVSDRELREKIFDNVTKANGDLNKLKTIKRRVLELTQGV